MTTTHGRAYSYLRFSTPDQAKGDSHRRQVQLAAEYAAAHGLELDTELTFSDLGVSAYHGRNARTGALQAFLRAVQDGIIPEGSSLLVESLDRLSREAVVEAQGLFLLIITAGITVVTLGDGRSYSHASVNLNPTDLIISLLTMIRAREESETKARRLRASWANKRTTAASAGKPMTATGPAWLQLVDGVWEVDEEKAAAVRRVFEMTKAGLGLESIARTMNREGVAPLSGQRAKRWHRSYVAKLRVNPAAIGALVPHTTEHKGGKRKNTPQEPIEGYYPAVVDPDTWHDVQAILQTHNPLRAGRTELLNVLGGLAKCPECGGSMVRITKGKRRPTSKAADVKLVCSGAKEGAGCAYRSVSYQRVEDALRQGIAQAVAQAPAGHDALDGVTEWIENQIRGREAELGELLDAVAGGALQRSPTVAQKIRDTEAELEGLRVHHEELLRDAAAHMGPMVERRLEALCQALAPRAALNGDGEQLDVAAANAALRQTASGVVVDHRVGQLVIQWQHGGESVVQYGMPAS